MGTTRFRIKIAMAACGLGLAASMLYPAANAFAENAETSGKFVEGKTGTTDVRVRADESNMKFEVPTVIPFSANAAGELTGPDPETIQLKNLSAYTIHLENMKISKSGDWNICPTVEATIQSETTDNIFFTVGPEDNLQNAADATADRGLNLSGDKAFELSFMGDAGRDIISLYTSGNIGRVRNGNLGVGTRVAQITWTFGAGGAIG